MNPIVESRRIESPHPVHFETAYSLSATLMDRSVMPPSISQPKRKTPADPAVDNYRLAHTTSPSTTATSVVAIRSVRREKRLGQFLSQTILPARIDSESTSQ